MKSLIVTGIGGMVGQGILRNIRAMQLGANIIGTNTEKVSAGNHLCDYVYQVPFAYEKNYIETIQEVASKHNAGLVIPSTDYEAHYLALNTTALSPVVVAASPHEVTTFCLDKYLNFLEFAKIGLPFAPSILPSNYNNEFKKVIVKPRAGRGSRDITINPILPTAFDDTYVVQEYLDGPELTTTFYVKQNGHLHGLITMERELEHGSTSRCEVVTEHDKTLLELVNRILNAFPFRGSCNIQSRVTKIGIIPFEINCRISGTNSIRAQLGFNDVAYTVQELFLHQPPEAPKIIKGSGIRICLDIIYPGKKLSQISDRDDNFWIF